MPAPNEITPSQLNRLIGLPDCPQIVDVCIYEDFREDPYLIPGSLRHDHRDLPGLLARLNGARAIIACQKGKKLSQGVAAWLAAEGVDALFLQGGMYAWRDHDGAARVPVAAIPDPRDGATLWVTRHRPKIDRIACPWLIRRFVDRQARFLFVAPSEVDAVADKLGATAFDVAGDWGHHSDGCSFDTMLAKFELTTPALARLADVVRGADLGQHDLHAASAGLLALSVGLSRRYRSDQEHVRAGLDIYDSLYRWARDGFEESHTHG